MPAGSMPDNELGERLGRALRADLGEPVDVPALINGSRGRARQIRQRRIGLATAGLVMVVAVPLGAELISSPDAAAPSAVLSSGEPNPRASRTIGPVPSPRTGAGTRQLPDALAFQPAELPRGVRQLAPEGGRSDQDTALPLVNGQTCRALTPADARPLSVRQWMWASPGAAGSQLRITLTVTSWDAGEGATAFADLVAGTGRCVFSTPQQTSTTSLYPGVQSWLAADASTSSSAGSTASAAEPTAGSTSGRVVVQLGDVIAGIEVQAPAGATGAESAPNLSRELGGIAAQRLKASGLG